MKKILVSIVIIVLVLWGITQAVENKEKNFFCVLENGLPIVAQQRSHIPLVNIVVAINLGSKNEDDRTSGMVHLLEHMLFVADTEYHTSDEINGELRKHGARFNAHTGNDLMNLELTVPSKFLEFGLGFIEEKLFHLRITPQQLEKEKKIIFEEISQYNDNPNTYGTFLALRSLFPGHPYERSISGNEEIIKNSTIQEINSFYKKFIVPSNCTLAVVGDIDLQKFEKILPDVYGKEEKKESPQFTSLQAVPLKKNISVEHKMDIQQAHLIIAFYAPPSDHKDQSVFQLLEQILGKGINPVLRSALTVRDQRLITGLSTQYIAMQYGGAFLVHLILEPKNIKAAQRELTKFLSNSWSFRFSIDDYPLEERNQIMDYVETAKSNILFLFQEFQETGLNAALTYARFVLFYKEPEKGEKQIPYIKRLEKIKSSDIKEIASRYLSDHKYVMISILPSGKVKKDSMDNEVEKHQ